MTQDVDNQEHNDSSLKLLKNYSLKNIPTLGSFSKFLYSVYFRITYYWGPGNAECSRVTPSVTGQRKPEQLSKAGWWGMPVGTNQVRSEREAKQERSGGPRLSPRVPTIQPSSLVTVTSDLKHLCLIFSSTNGDWVRQGGKPLESCLASKKSSAWSEFKENEDHFDPMCRGSAFCSDSTGQHLKEPRKIPAGGSGMSPRTEKAWKKVPKVRVPGMFQKQQTEPEGAGGRGWDGGIGEDPTDQGHGL